MFKSKYTIRMLSTAWLTLLITSLPLAFPLSTSEALSDEAKPSTTNITFPFQKIPPKPIAGTHKAQFFVSNKLELFAALESARSGELIYIKDNTKINLTKHDEIKIPSGVTLASGGGHSDKRGALLFTQQKRVKALFVANGENVRITGLRIIGPDFLHRKTHLEKLRLISKSQYYKEPTSLAFSTAYDNTTIDHSELAGWGYAAIKLHNGASGGYIFNNHIHHNQRWGLGYGVVLSNAKAIIESNLFDWNRHSIAGSGLPGTSYEAKYNVILEHTRSHVFDMHGGEDRQDGTDIAGDLILIHNNTFFSKSHPAIKIRGRPQIGAYIYNNCFLHNKLQAMIGKTLLGRDRNIHINNNTYSGLCKTDN